MKEYRMNTGTHEISFQLDERQVIYYAALADLPKKQEEASLIEEALDHPYGAERLEDAVPKDGKVVIIVDDATRPTPCARILPHLLARGESDDAARARISQFELYYDDNYDTSIATDAKGAKAEASSIMNDGRGAANVINNNWTTKSGTYNDYCGWVSNTKPTPHWVQIDLGADKEFNELAFVFTGCPGPL